MLIQAHGDGLTFPQVRVIFAKASLCAHARARRQQRNRALPKPARARFYMVLPLLARARDDELETLRQKLFWQYLTLMRQPSRRRCATTLTARSLLLVAQQI